MNRLNKNQRCQVITSLIEGCSIRSTVRMTGVSKKAVMRLLVEAGNVCASYQDQAFRTLTRLRIQIDEMWAFLYCKAKNITPEIADRNPNAGDIWLWVAMDADSKLVPSWFLRARDASAAEVLMLDLASRLSHRVQLTTDGHRAYLSAVESAFGSNIDYSMLVKMYGGNLPKQIRATVPESV